MESQTPRPTGLISIIIPCYNEGDTPRRASEQARRALAEAGYDRVEIILVDDGSTDGSLAETPPEADLLVRHLRNRGYGAALKTGFARATGDIIVFMDADGTYDPAAIPRLIERLGPETPMAVGARSGATNEYPLMRRIAKWPLRALADYLAGRRIPDLNSGLRAVSRNHLWDYLHLLPDGFSLTTTLTLALMCDGYEVAYVPIPYSARVGASKIHPLRDTQQILITILRTVTYFHPLKVFVPLSVLLALAALIVLVVSALFFDKVMDGTVSVLVLSACQSIALGLMADVIGRSSRPCPHRGKIIR